MASCPGKILLCSKSGTRWSFTIRAYKLLDVADKRPRYNISIADYILFSKYVRKKIGLSRLVFMYRLPYENILRIRQISEQMAHSYHNYSKSIDRLFKHQDIRILISAVSKIQIVMFVQIFLIFMFFELK